MECKAIIKSWYWEKIMDILKMDFCLKNKSPITFFTIILDTINRWDDVRFVDHYSIKEGMRMSKTS